MRTKATYMYIFIIAEAFRMYTYDLNAGAHIKE